VQRLISFSPTLYVSRHPLHRRQTRFDRVGRCQFPPQHRSHSGGRLEEIARLPHFAPATVSITGATNRSRHVLGPHGRGRKSAGVYMDLLCRSSFNAGMLSTDFFSVGSGVLSRTETIMGQRKGFHALHRSLVEASRTMAIKFHHTARYKNGTSSQAFFAFPSLPYRALQCDRCLVITMFSSLLSRR